MRVMVELPNTEALRAAYADGELEPLLRHMREAWGLSPALYRVLDLPARRFGFAVFDERGFEPDLLARLQRLRPPEAGLLGSLGALTLALEFATGRAAAAGIARIRARGGRAGASVPVVPLGGGNVWDSGDDRPPVFGTRGMAEALVGADAARGRGLDGRGVNIVMFDAGVSRAALVAAGFQAYAGGWPVQDTLGNTRLPGTAAPDGHGTMVARAALALAPGARLWDLPFRPERILDPVGFSEDAATGLRVVAAQIRDWLAPVLGPCWVFCHPWGIYDRRLEHPRGGFTNDPANPFNLLVREMDRARAMRFDQVFGAGNGGQFAPHPRCGPGDTGPGRSILAANSSPRVLTVGAVRADGTWIGYSSQGPGQPGFGRPPKPDLCAPSHHLAEGTGAPLLSGTSAAAGAAAGAVAALRSRDPADAELAALPGIGNAPPLAMRALLRRTARKPPTWKAGEGYDIRFGHGILDLEAALAEAPASST